MQYIPYEYKEISNVHKIDEDVKFNVEGYKRLGGISIPLGEEGQSGFYINTSYNPSKDTKILMSVTPIEGSNNFHWGCRTQYATNYFFSIGITKDGYWDYGVKLSSTVSSGIKATAGQKVVIGFDCPNNNFIYNGKTTLISNTSGISNWGYIPAFTLFSRRARVYYGTLATQFNQVQEDVGNMIVSRCSIYEKDVLLHDLIAAQKVSTGVNGMYDIIENKFFSAENNKRNFQAHALR